MSLKAVIGNTITMTEDEVTNNGNITFQVTLLLPDLSSAELQEVLNTFTTKNGAVMVRLEKELT